MKNNIHSVNLFIDPCAGSGSTLRACAELGREAHGFEVSKEFYKKAKKEMLLQND